MATSNRSIAAADGGPPACGGECLNFYEFDDLIEAKIALTDWKTSYNKTHRHSKLGYLTPDEYAAQCKCTHRLYE